MKRHASATWRGGLKDGKGAISIGSGVLKDTPYTFITRFEEAPGTNPEELVAAAHAACVAMALSNELGKLGFTPESIQTDAALDFDKTTEGWTVKSVHLELKARVPKADRATFRKAAETARKNCPISRLLNTKITMSAELE